MNGQLSNGLPGLGTSGNRIINLANGEPVILRGVNRSGLEYAGPAEQGFLSGASLSRSEIEFIVRKWSCNIIRLPFNQDFVLRGRLGHSGEEYQEAIDQVIYWASLFGAYTLLDLQWLDAERVYGGNRNFVAPLPNMESVELWTTLARRYASEPAVLYDVFNEPHDRLNDDPYPLNKEDGTTSPSGPEARDDEGVEALGSQADGGNSERESGPLVFVGGTNWAYRPAWNAMDLRTLFTQRTFIPTKAMNGRRRSAIFRNRCPSCRGVWRQ